MDIDQYKLIVFCTVAETTSITKAAKILCLTQPAVSIHISTLECIIEAKLINRDQFGSDRLTITGEALYRQAKEILRMHAFARRDIAGINCPGKVDIRIGAFNSFENHILPGIVTDFNKRRPGVKLSITAGDGKWITNLLLAGDIDIGIIDDIPVKKRLLAEPLMSNELYVIVPPQHPWAELKTVTIGAVAKRPLILGEEGAGIGRTVRNFFASNGISRCDLDIALVLTSPIARLDAVESGLGISFASMWEIRTEVKYKRLVPLAIGEGNPTSRSYLVTPKNAPQSRVIKEFIDYLKSYPYERKCHSVGVDAGIQLSKKQCVQANPSGYDSDKALSIQT